MDKKELKDQLASLREKRAELEGEFETVTRGAVDEAGEARAFTPDEAEKRGELKAQIAHTDEQIEKREDEYREVKKAERQQQMDDAVAQMRRELGLGDVAPNSVGGNVTDIREHRTYEKNNGVSFLKDTSMVAFPAGAIGAEWFRAMERIQQHGRENHYEALELDQKRAFGDGDGDGRRTDREDYFYRQMLEARNDRKLNQGSLRDRGMNYRALSTSSTAGGEFVPPLYLTDEWIKFLRAGRVVADQQHHEDLPDGTMSINIPKVATGTSVATQGTQNTNVSMTDLTTQFVTFPVVTKAGQQVVSLQLLERSPIAFDSVVTGDLALAYAQQVDVAVINGPGSGDVTGILNTSGITTVTWTQASPTAGGFYGRVGVAKRSIAQSIYLPATDCFITPDAWEWLSQTLDSQNRPLVVPAYQGPYNALAVTADAATAEGRVGRSLNGLATWEDANVPVISSDDVAIISRPEMNYLYESPVINRALPQTYGAQLSVLLQLYGYIAFTAARYPTANVVITGTGMANPRTYNS